MTKKTAVRYKKYTDTVVGQNVRSIGDIVSAVCLSSGDAVKDLRDNDISGLLKDVYMRGGSREIVQNGMKPRFPHMFRSPDGARTVAVCCPRRSSGNVSVSGGVSAYEYCGSP
ncbi:MAG: hypothetical protein LBP79_04255 [Clostridiales bacterium]|jgi:hypothetical protein|nr:hypothetical protein [Clostridiales bacterium]